MTASLSQHFTAYVGIDWADTKHDIAYRLGMTIIVSSTVFRTRLIALMSGPRHCTCASVALSL